jgi:hypothetical protein
MRVDKVLEKLAKTDKVMVSLEALPEGKIRANTSAWGDAKVLLRNEVLEVQVIDGQLRLACKERSTTTATRRSSRMTLTGRA